MKTTKSSTLNSLQVRVYDLPTRIFHWVFAVLFLIAFIIAKTVDDESPTYPYHMLAGMVLVTSVILRILWGILGSHYAKFNSFILSPKKLFDYLLGIFKPHSPRTLGHNPASSWAALIMIALTLGLGITGYLMTEHYNKRTVKEIHELFANAFIITVIAHVLGVIVHTFKHRDSIALSMIHGKKSHTPSETALQNTVAVVSPHYGVAILFVALLAGTSTYLITHYNPVEMNLNLFGKQIQLGETEEEHERKRLRKEHSSEEHQDKDQDHDEDDHKE